MLRRIFCGNERGKTACYVSKTLEIIVISRVFVVRGDLICPAVQAGQIITPKYL